MTKLITGVQLKCIVPGTLVLTDRGIVPVEDIVVGDKILDGEGKFSPVKMTISRRHRGEVVKIVPVGYGRGFETTLDHRTWAMKVATPVRRALQRGEAVDEAPRADWVEAQELEVGDVLPVPKLCTDPSPKTLVLENLRSRKPGPKPLVSIPVTAEFYRLLGYILADGSSHAQWISISFGDHETENIADCVNLVRAVLDRKACVLSRPDVAVKIVHFSFKAFAQWLRDNCGKSDDKKLPLWLLQQATDVELREFVVGAVRGDGGLSASSSALGTKRKMQFTNTSSKLTQAVMLACNRLGLLGGLVLPARRQSNIRGETFDTKQQYIWQITGTACDRIAKMIGHDWDVEKSKSFQQGWHDATHVYRPIKEISRRVYDGPVIDLVIDGHPSFTLPGALVHNCITASEKMARGKHLPGLVADEASIVPGTLIWTRRGIVPIETVVTDDLVFAADGQWRKVIATTSHPYSGKIVKLTGCGDGIGAWITEEHRVFGATGIGVTRSSTGRIYASSDTALPASDWHRAWDYDVGDVLSYPRPQRVGNLPEFLVSGDTRLWRFLGYWCGDGGASVTKTDNYPIELHLGTAKSFFVNDAIDCMSHVLDRRVRTEASPSRPNSIDLVVSSCKEWWERLRNLVGMQDDRGIPLEWLEAASDDDLRNFMIGLLRTDGDPAFRPDGILAKWSWTGTSQHLAANVMYCTSRLGIPASVGTRDAARYGIPSKPRWDIHIRWDYAKKILLDEDVEGMRFPTKAFNPKQWCDESLWHSVITKIDEDYYEGTVYDLQVEGDPSFGCLQRMMLHNCQDDVNADNTFKAAMQMSMSEPEHIILLLSTFHHPVGLFQEIWDGAEQKGFKRYAWNVFDVMERCAVGLDRATKDDPDAQSFCRNECPLTQNEAVYDENDKLVGTRFIGCDGAARRSRGFLPRNNVINAMVLNEGSEIFKVEFMCKRPQFSGPIYGLEAIENAQVSEITIDDHEPTIVGIDWGVTEGVLILGKDSLHAGPQVLASRYLSVKLVGEYIKILTEWQDEYGHLSIYADSSHPFEIGDLEQAGFEVVPVDFATMKDYGITNLLKMFMYGKIRILDDNTRLVAQLKSYRKDPKTGRPLKINDHGPDALLCMAITIDFTERWADLITSRVAGLARTKLLTTIDELGLDKKADKSEVDENVIDRDNNVMLF
jgi:intein/homing endonuclease